MKRIFHHIGLPTDQSRPGEVFIEATRVWISDPANDPYRIEYIRFEPDSPVTGPLRDMSHVAYRIEDMDVAMEGEEDVIMEPFVPRPGLTVAFVMQEGALIEFMKFEGGATEFVNAGRNRRRVELPERALEYCGVLPGKGHVCRYGTMD